MVQWELTKIKQKHKNLPGGRVLALVGGNPIHRVGNIQEIWLYETNSENYHSSKLTVGKGMKKLKKLVERKTLGTVKKYQKAFSPPTTWSGPGAAFSVIFEAFRIHFSP